jgi:DNA polymerase III subunit delta
MKAADWDLRKLQLSLDKGKPANIYVLHGEELFLLDQALESLRHRVLTGGAADFNFDSFTAPETPAAHVRDTVETLPMMSERRLVLYKNVDVLKDESWEALYPLLENPIDTATLVIVATKLDKRKKAIKKLQESAIFVELKKPYDNQIAGWVDYIAYLQGLKMTPEAVGVIQQLVGTSLSEIQNEVKKIQQFIGEDKKTIDVDDVLKVVSRARVESVFNLTDALGRRDRAEALVCLARLLEQGQNEIGILSLIYRQIRILSSVYEGKKQGLSGSRLSEKVGVPEFFLRQYLEQVRLWDREKIASTVKALHETDKALKSSPVSSHIWLENFIVRTC